MGGFRIVKLLDPLNIVNIPGGLVPKGAYNAGTTYSIGDSVDYNGSSYVLFAAAPSGTLPTDTTKWQVLANKGDASTVPGPTGPAGPAGSGTVSSVSVTTANGVSGSVANATTTPAISLTLGAITPTSVNGTTSTEIGYVSGLTSSVQTQIDGKFTLPSLTSGSVLFSDGTTIVQDNANFFFDTTNKKLNVTQLDVGATGTMQFRHLLTSNYADPYGLNILASPRVSTWTSLQGTFQQSMVFADGDATHNIFGLAVSQNSGAAFTPAFVVSQTGMVAIGTNNPTYGLTLGSTVTGLADYNTTDQTTNSELARHYWSGNSYIIGTSNLGTGSIRPLRFQSGATTGITLDQGSSTAKQSYSTVTTSLAGIVGYLYTGGFSASSGTQTSFYINPTYTQSGTAGATDLLINRIETSVGSGSQRLLDLQVGGVSKLIVNSQGTITVNDGAQFILGTTTGTSFGTTTSQKLSFFGVTPVVQQAANQDLGTTLSNLGLRGAGSTYTITTSGVATFNNNLSATTNFRQGALVRTGTSFNIATTSVNFNDIDASAGAYTVNLPSTTTAGYWYVIRKMDASANAVTITGTINGATNYVLPNQGDYVAVVSTTTSGVWEIWSNNMKVVAGTNVTVTGSGLPNDAYVINSTGGGGGGSGITRSVVVTSGSYTLGSTALTDYIYLVSALHAGTMPTASGNSNRYTVKNNHTASVTVTRAGSDTIEGSTSITIQPGDSVDLVSNNTNAWSVI